MLSKDLLTYYSSSKVALAILLLTKYELRLILISNLAHRLQIPVGTSTSVNPLTLIYFCILKVVIVSGSVFSELSLVHEGPKTSSFVHTVRLYHGPKGNAGFFLVHVGFNWAVSEVNTALDGVTHPR